LSKNYGFRATFLDSPGIRGRYSSLIHFGLLLSAIWSSDPQTLVSQALAMRDMCRQPEAADKNPALGLAAFLAGGALDGSDKLLLLGTRSIRNLTYRIGQLVGASMCKERQGLLPVCDEVPRWLEIYRRGFTAAILAMRGDDDSEIKEFEMVLRRAGLPTVSIEIDSPESWAPRCSSGKSQRRWHAFP
jgi:glucose-6-phosphate isomerase